MGPGGLRGTFDQEMPTVAGGESGAGGEWGGSRRGLWMLIAGVDEAREGPLSRLLAFPMSSGWAGKKWLQQETKPKKKKKNQEELPWPAAALP